MIRSLLRNHLSDHLIKLTIRKIVPLRHYPRRTQPMPPSTYLQMNEDDDVLDESEIKSRLDEIEDQLHVDSSDKDLSGHEKATRQWLKKKIIGKKYFRKQPELSLLSWNAKEQIRYLHDKDPNEWSVANLARSFPVSEEGIIKILRSSYEPRTQDEIEKHDMRVRNHWYALRSYMRQLNHAIEPEEGGPVAHAVQELVDSKRLSLMINAGGMNSVNLPQTKPRIFVRKKVGTFEAIVKDYVENERKTQQDKELSLSLDECQPLLRDISNFRHIQTEKLTERSYSNKKSGRDLKKTDDSKVSTRSRRGRRLVESLRKGTLESSLLVDSNITELGMQGTGRAGGSHQSETTLQHFSEWADINSSRTQQDKEKQIFESQRRKSHYKVTDKVAFMSGSESGYPLEQSDKELDKLEVPESLKNKGDLYQRGNCVYDDDGEFLFKIP